jgi:hypothetical protein
MKHVLPDFLMTDLNDARIATRNPQVALQYEGASFCNLFATKV